MTKITENDIEFYAIEELENLGDYIYIFKIPLNKPKKERQNV